ncbi:hypothetical protein ACFRMO_10650 [Streptomyces anulatus]|uniref:hypothetical protein n=1 Tax=Streptomyces TaxID=1883 RepID=UPI00067BF59D|nr:MULTISPECIES: hypothetical protein [Streptomyces]KND24817.1 hypothetical protein IQ60_33445 [Streptomyces europaeiscabiei]KQX32051.1 hypothetical protein ASD29_14640 [Streptomyces sp. Root1295]KRA39617.1 hypothetical protein ASD97_17270 [Streptomyces sp. Root63]MBT1101548.1 hypothetical protein [Streptomyces sp. Tu10]OKI81998.1 hypothetical protein AMK12_01405 [Streptomyces sp. TSRI0395]
MTLTDFARRVTDSGTCTVTGSGAAGPDAGAAPGATGQAPAPAPVVGADAAVSRAVGREADGLAVASFVLGLVGLLVFNVLLGPTAIVMALLALARRTRRRGRALLGLALGVADLVVLAVLVTGNGAVAWNFGG